MDKKKVIIWTTVGVVGALAITFTILALRKRKKKKEAEELQKLKDEENAEKLEESSKASEGQQAQAKASDKVTPTRDINRALNNNFNDLKGKTLYPARKSSNPVEGHTGAEGYANVRTSAEVNTGTWNNFLQKVEAGQPIGTVLAESNDNMSPPMRWFKVKLSKPYDGWFGDYTEGWVRGDNVTFTPYTKGKSSFQGDIVKYKTDYPLGSDVFPHPNWMLPNTQEPIHQSYDIDDVIMDI